jgi:hypothetical protein
MFSKGVNHPQLTFLNSLSDSAEVSNAPLSIWPLGPSPSIAELFAATDNLRKRTVKPATDIAPTVELTQKWLAGQKVDYHTVGEAVSNLQVIVLNAASRVDVLDSQLAHTQGAVPPTRNDLEMVNGL